MKRTALNISSLTFLGALLLLLLASISVVYAADGGYINVDVNKSPQFDGSVLKGVAPVDVSFNTWMPEHKSGTTYSWDFGDGSTSTERSPTHKYTHSGNYTVKLTVTNSSGTFTTEKPNYIKVGTLPIARFHADEIQGIAPLKVHFIDESTGDPESWFWDFGDGNTSTAQSPEYLYTRSGSYNVTLTVKNDFGSSTLMRMSDGRMVYLPTASESNNSTTSGTNSSSTNGSASNGSSTNGSASNGTIVTDATNGTTVVDGGADANNTGSNTSGKQSPDEPLPETAVPGFSVVAAVFVVIGLAALLYRRK